jgi:hypothetical protein
VAPARPSLDDAETIEMTESEDGTWSALIPPVEADRSSATRSWSTSATAPSRASRTTRPIPASSSTSARCAALLHRLRDRSVRRRLDARPHQRRR